MSCACLRILNIRILETPVNQFWTEGARREYAPIAAKSEAAPESLGPPAPRMTRQPEMLGTPPRRAKAGSPSRRANAGPMCDASWGLPRAPVGSRGILAERALPQHTPLGRPKFGAF